MSYKNMSNDEIENHLSQFIIQHLSFSAISTFCRNEKDFEMKYIYREKGKNSSTQVSGQAYHSALELYFSRLIDGEVSDIIDLQMEAHRVIDRVNPTTWKLTKTKPNAENCLKDAIDRTNKGVANFLAEISTYTNDLKKVLGVEISLTEFITLCSVDVPLPFKMKIDTVIELNDGRKILIDHKLKSTTSSDEDVKYTIGKQAIIYVNAYEAKYKTQIDEVWVIENKTSKNKDGSPQLSKHEIVLDADTRRMYEAILFESVSKVIKAVSDVDYVYVINDSDSYVDKSELYEFWIKTMLEDIDSFDIQEENKEKIKYKLRKAKESNIGTLSPNIIRRINTEKQFINYNFRDKDMKNEEKIEAVLKCFGIAIRVKHVLGDYSCVTYLIEVSAGISVSSVNRYKLDIASALGVSNVRILKDLIVYDGNAYLAIETSIKNDRILLFDKSKLIDQRLPIGVDNFGNTLCWNLNNHSTPHALVCGATGSGKSVLIRSTIEYAILAGVEDIYIFDPKFEFKKYAKHAKIFNEIEDIESQMRLLVKEMEIRVKSGSERKTLVIFDEFADAVANSAKGRKLDIIEEVQDGYYAPKGGISIPKMKMKKVGTLNSLEENLRILLQKGRSSGFRIMAAAQRASVNVITGDAKVNFPVVICFRVPKDTDSQVVLDESGAECLNGHGDGLMKSPEYQSIMRFQGFFKK